MELNLDIWENISYLTQIYIKYVFYIPERKCKLVKKRKEHKKREESRKIVQKENTPKNFNYNFKNL